MNFKKNIAPWKKFPSVETLGYYHSMGNYISLNNIEDEAEFIKLSKNPTLDRTKFSVYIHEMQHYYDQVSTLWGIQNIYKIYRAFDSIIKQKESDFYKSREMILTLKRDRFIDYYTTILNNIPGNYKNPWKFKITIGYRYTHAGEIDELNPIPFVTFATSKDIPVTRVPISIVSLLETLQLTQNISLK